MSLKVYLYFYLKIIYPGKWQLQLNHGFKVILNDSDVAGTVCMFSVCVKLVCLCMCAHAPVYLYFSTQTAP